ncbi:unnamed protein product [Mycena citricolor]|uniref:DUF829-domain-containing protein n=1 Tax=Mycena citricolor TaxID=2018698 RepID=A0AAD2HTS1_9AGAR|nr:unnamed protein product [Mycena citricolor]
MATTTPKPDTWGDLVRVAQSAEDALASNDLPLVFEKLGPDVNISYSTSPAHGANDPRVVVLFGWMDAPHRLLEKYAAKHRKRWPAADIITVQSHPSFIWSSEQKRDDTLAPIADFLLSTVYHSSQDVKRGMLMHVISNGGAFQFITLSRLMARKLASSDSRRTVRTATIFDSTPGASEYTSLIATLTTDIKSPAVKAVATVPLTMAYTVMLARRLLLGQANLFSDLHASLLRPELFPCAASHAPRLYIYSSEDRMVPFTSVEEHLVKLQSAGICADVSVERFSGSQHVQHERLDPARYWSAVERMWERSALVRVKL